MKNPSKEGFLSAQRLFDKAAVGMLLQNKRSANWAGCRYHSEDGCRCALGFILTDEAYSAELEGFGIRGANPSRLLADPTDPRSKVVQALQRSKVDVRDPRLFGMLQSLQKIHDIEPIQLWPRELKKLALRHGLSTKSIDKVIDERASADE